MPNRLGSLRLYRPTARHRTIGTSSSQFSGVRSASGRDVPRGSGGPGGDWSWWDVLRSDIVGLSASVPGWGFAPGATQNLLPIGTDRTQGRAGTPDASRPSGSCGAGRRARRTAQAALVSL